MVQNKNNFAANSCGIEKLAIVIFLHLLRIPHQPFFKNCPAIFNKTKSNDAITWYRCRNFFN
jgi:hypothetical protein